MKEKKTWLPLAAVAVMVLASLFLLSGKAPEDTGPVEATPLPFAMAEESVAPAPQSLADEYFRVTVSYHPAVAGSSLARARVACSLFRYAADNELRSADIPTLRENMLVAWESLSDQERSAFDGNFMEVVTLLASCKDDWEGNRGLFDDAGVGEQMAALIVKPENWESWETLKAHTLTMGNSEG